MLLFNPPYVPTTEEEEQQAQRDAAIAGSWAGGNTGTKLLEVLFEDVDGLGRGAGIEVSGRVRWTVIIARTLALTTPSSSEYPIARWYLLLCRHQTE